MVLNINKITTQNNEGQIVTNDFLQEYHMLLSNLKDAFQNSSDMNRNRNNVIFYIAQMKDFAIQKGGYKCVELLAEYEKNFAIGDYAGCSGIKERILTELNYFKEFWVSLLS